MAGESIAPIDQILISFCWARKSLFGGASVVIPHRGMSIPTVAEAKAFIMENIGDE